MLLLLVEAVLICIACEDSDQAARETIQELTDRLKAAEEKARKAQQHVAQLQSHDREEPAPQRSKAAQGPAVGNKRQKGSKSAKENKDSNVLVSGRTYSL